jgi:hypothetical protein
MPRNGLIFEKGDLLKVSYTYTVPFFGIFVDYVRINVPGGHPQTKCKVYNLDMDRIHDYDFYALKKIC